AEATIDEIYTSAPSQDYNAPTFDEYGLVHFDAQGKRAHARVLLATNCSGTCAPTYRVGQVLAVDYNPENLTYASIAFSVPRTCSFLVPAIAIWFAGNHPPRGRRR